MKNRYLTMTLIVLSLLALLLVIRVVRQSRSEAIIRGTCRGRLCHLSISLALCIIDDEHGRMYLSTLSNLLDRMSKKYPSAAAQMFICPASETVPATLSDIEQWSDYVLLPGRSPDDEDGTVLMYCRPENHGGDGANVLYVDGTTEWLPIGELAALLSQIGAELLPTKLIP